MSMPLQSEVRNRLLQAISAQGFQVLCPHLEYVDLPLRHVLVETSQPNSHVYFIESGLGSVVATSSDNEIVEVGHVGSEGLGGYHVLLMTRTTTHRTFMQSQGSGYRIPVDVFMEAVDNNKAMRTLLLRYVHSCEMQLAHSALANARYSMHERLSRWLLMCHDRLNGDNLPITHEFLSLMLGVRRSGVTDQLHILEGMHVIKATRGNVRIVDRQKLEEIAAGCYGLPEREYTRLIETCDTESF